MSRNTLCCNVTRISSLVSVRVEEVRVPGRGSGFGDMRQVAGARAGAVLTIANLSQLTGALEYAGLPADELDDGGPGGGWAWVLCRDDALAQIEDHHVAEMRSEIVMSRWRVGGRRGIRSATPTSP